MTSYKTKQSLDEIHKVLAWHEFRLDYHAAIIKQLGATMATQDELDAAVASLTDSLNEIDEKSTSTQESVDAIQAELDALNAQVEAGEPVDLSGLNAAVAQAQQEATDLSTLAADAAASVPVVEPPPPTDGGGGEEPPFDPGNPSQAPSGDEPPGQPIDMTEHKKSDDDEKDSKSEKEPQPGDLGTPDDPMPSDSIPKVPPGFDLPVPPDVVPPGTVPPGEDGEPV